MNTILIIIAVIQLVLTVLVLLGVRVTRMDLVSLIVRFQATSTESLQEIYCHQENSTFRSKCLMHTFSDSMNKRLDDIDTKLVRLSALYNSAFLKDEEEVVVQDRVYFFVPGTGYSFEGIYIEEDENTITFLTDEGVTKKLPKGFEVSNEEEDPSV